MNTHSAFRTSAILILALIAVCLPTRAHAQMEPVSRLLVANGVEVWVSREEPGLGVQGVGWRVVNLTADTLRVDGTKTYYAAPSGRLVGTSRFRSLLLHANETISGGRFTGDDLDLWDDFFYDEDLQRGERIGRITVTVSVRNVSAERRAERDEQERLAEQQRREEERRLAAADAERRQREAAARQQAEEDERRRQAERIREEAAERERERDAAIAELADATAQAATADVGDGPLRGDFFFGAAYGSPGIVNEAGRDESGSGFSYAIGGRYVHWLGPSDNPYEPPMLLELVGQWSSVVGTKSGLSGSEVAQMTGGDAMISVDQIEGTARLWLGDRLSILGGMLAVGLSAERYSYEFTPDQGEASSGSFTAATPLLSWGLLGDKDGYMTVTGGYAPLTAGTITKAAFEGGIGMGYAALFYTKYVFEEPVAELRETEVMRLTLGLRLVP